MQISDCLNLMTKIYLSRVIDSIYKENIPKGNEEQLKEKIEQNKESLSNEQRVKKALDLSNMPRSNRILVHFILTILLEKPDMATTEEDLFQSVQDYEKSIVDKSKDPNAFAFSDNHSIDIYETVLEVALQDSDISEDEFHLLEKLRKKLQINRLEHCLLESKLGKFPKDGNQLHSYEELKQAHLELQKKGILFFCNKAKPNNLIVLPEEISKVVSKVIKFEMGKEAQKLLHDTFTSEQLRNVCRSQGLPVSGTKQEVSNRLIETQTKPSEILDSLSNDELYAICHKLPGVHKSGTKQAKINNIINYFASLTNKPPVESTDKREIYYQYFEELAERNNKELYRLGIIKRDRDMEFLFEEATRYLFEKKLGCPLVKQDGAEHADGGVKFPNGELLLWDNKGKEQKYKFPKSHADQFLRYIRNSTQRIRVFLIIVPDVLPEAEQQALHLKYNNPTDTDVALITAMNLKFLAENWKELSKKECINLNIFNMTGIIDRQKIEHRLNIL